jgi:hypothetical protein
MNNRIRFHAYRAHVAICLLVCAIPVLSVKAQSAETERPLFIIDNNGQYLEVFSKRWIHQNRFTGPCDDCEAYIDHYHLFKSDTYTPLITGEVLAALPNQLNTVSAFESGNQGPQKAFAEPNQVSLVMCPRGQTPSKSVCWYPMNYSINTIGGGVYREVQINVAGNLFEIVHGFGDRVSVVSESDRGTIAGKLDAEQRALADQRIAMADERQRAVADRRIRDQQIENEAVEMRKTIRVGTHTNCGPVFDVRLPMIGVQTAIGMQFIEVTRLYGASADCHFENGIYQGR